MSIFFCRKLSSSFSLDSRPLLISGQSSSASFSGQSSSQSSSEYIFLSLILNSYHLPFLTSFVIITFIPFMCFLNTSFASFSGLDCCIFSLILLPAYDLLLDCHPLPNICLPILTFFLDSQPTPLTQYCHMISHPLPLLLDSHPLPLLLLMESHPSYFSSGQSPSYLRQGSPSIPLIQFVILCLFVPIILLESHSHLLYFESQRHTNFRIVILDISSL